MPDLGGYRGQLEDTLLARGFDFDFVGSMSTGPASLADKHNEGHQGQGIPYFNTNFPTWYASTPCDVVLCMVGTAQIALQSTVSQMGDQLSTLLGTMFSTAPSLQVIVANLPGFGPGSYYQYRADVVGFNAKIPPVVEAHQAAGRNVSWVDMYSVIDPVTETNDGVHPTEAGYIKMAAVWANALIKIPRMVTAQRLYGTMARRFS